MQKWRNLFNRYSSTVHLDRDSEIPFRPRLHFSDSILHHLPAANNLSSATSLFNLRSKARSSPRSYNRRWNSGFSPRSRCYRCGGEGHWAKICRAPFSCFYCGGVGHTKSVCPSIARKNPPSFASSSCWEMADFQYARLIEDPKWLDCMLLDPDVSACSENGKGGLSLFTDLKTQLLEGKKPELKMATTEESISALAVSEGLVEEVDEEQTVLPISEQKELTYLDPITPLQLLDQRPMSLANVFIIDEMTPKRSAIRSKECRELFYFTDPFKFYLYCAIQGFQFVARALGLPHLLNSPPRKKKRKSSSKICLFPLRRSPRLLKAK